MAIGRYYVSDYVISYLHPSPPPHPVQGATTTPQTATRLGKFCTRFLERGRRGVEGTEKKKKGGGGRSQQQKQKASSTLRTSQAVPHPSTDRAFGCLTSEFGWDRVCSTEYGRWRKQYAPKWSAPGWQCRSWDLNCNNSTRVRGYRSHFGSRYNSGRCVLRSPFLSRVQFPAEHFSSLRTAGVAARDGI